MTNDNLDIYLNLKEGLKVELKSAQNGLPKSLWETYSSFANTSGGVIYLGITEGSPNKIIGVNKPYDLVKDFFTTLNNPSKVSKNILKDEDFKIINIEDKYIIEITVKEASVYDKPIYLHGSILNSYKRNFEGDFKMNNLELVTFIDDAKVESKDSLDNNLGFGFDTVDIKTLEEFRKDLNEASPDNIFINDSNEEFLINSGYLRLNNDGKYVLSNAGVYLFSTPAFIKRINATYFLDYQEKEDENDEFWINRITTDDIDYVGNLYNFYKRVIKELLKNLPKPLYLEGVQDQGEANIRFIVREAFLNNLSNADFNRGDAIKIIKTSSKIIFKNSGRLKIPYLDAIKFGNSDPRNKALMSTFRNLKLCDRGGTGLPRIFKISSNLHLYRPLLIDDSVKNETVLTIYLKFDHSKEYDKINMILSCLEKRNDFVSIADLATMVNINRTTVSKLVNDLIDDEILITNGLTTKGKKIKLK